MYIAKLGKKGCTPNSYGIFYLVSKTAKSECSNQKLPRNIGHPDMFILHAHRQVSRQ